VKNQSYVYFYKVLPATMLVFSEEPPFHESMKKQGFIALFLFLQFFHHQLASC